MSLEHVTLLAKKNTHVLFFLLLLDIFIFVFATNKRREFVCPTDEFNGTWCVHENITSSYTGVVAHLEFPVRQGDGQAARVCVCWAARYVIHVYSLRRIHTYLVHCACTRQQIVTRGKKRPSASLA